MGNENGSKKFFIAIVTGLILMVVNVVFTLAFRNDKTSAVMQEKLDGMDKRLIRIENTIDEIGKEKLDEKVYNKQHSDLEYRISKAEDNIIYLNQHTRGGETKAGK
jgi:hypothetical protein